MVSPNNPRGFFFLLTGDLVEPFKFPMKRREVLVFVSGAKAALKIMDGNEPINGGYYLILLHVQLFERKRLLWDLFSGNCSFSLLLI